MKRRSLSFFAAILASIAALALHAQSPAPDQGALKEIDLSLLGSEADRQEVLEGALKKGNVDFGQSTIHYWTVNPGYASTQSYPPEKEDLAVVDYAPTGELPIEMRRPTIYVMFNLPMVPVAKLGEPMAKTPLMTIDPPVEGVYRWYGTKVLSFQPDGTIVDKPRYTVRIAPEASSLGGKRLGKAFSFEFHTEPVKVVNFAVGGDADSYYGAAEVPTKAGRRFILEFNQPVDPKHVSKFIDVSIDGPGKARKASFSVARPAYPARLATRAERAVLLTLDADPPEDSQVSVTLADKASPQPGYPERKGGQTMSFHTVTPFRLLSLNANAYDMPRDNKPGVIPVYAEFSHPLDKKASAQAYGLSVNGKAVAPAALDVFGSTLRIGLSSLEPGDIVVLQAPAAVADVYGRPLSNPETSVRAKIPAPYPLVEFPWGFHHLEAAFAPKFIWDGRNLDTLFLGKEGADRFRFDLDDRERSNKPVPLPYNIASWKKNRVNYVIQDLQKLLNPQGFGTAYFNYKATYTHDSYRSKDGHPFAIQVTDLGITTRVAYNRVLVWVNSLSSGKPVAGATVDLGRSSDAPLKTAQTDSAGFASIPLKSGEFRSLFHTEYSRYDLVVSASKDGDRADMLVGNTVNSYASTVYAHSPVVDAEGPVSRILIFTDRGLYKPGEELALRGMHWTQDPDGYDPFKGSFHLQLDDFRSGEVLWKYDGKTSESGGFATRFNLPKDLEPGSYRIRYSSQGPGMRRGGYYGDDSDDPGVSFTVAQFRKLAFQVEASVPDRPYFAGDDASVAVKASYLAGGSMPGAEYSYFWTRKPMAFAPPGPLWANYVFGPGNWEGEKTLENGKGVLGGDGQASIGVKTDAENAVGAAYDYVLETTVQDVDRQAIANTSHVTVHPASFYLGLRFSGGSATGWWSRFVSTGQQVKVDAVLAAPDGQAWTRDARLTARILKGEWKGSEQQGVYGRINTRWEYVETEVSSQQVKAAAGAASWSFSVKDSGDYLLSVEARDPSGRLSKTVIRFYATGSGWVRRASATPSDIEMIADKDLYLPGETARILVRSPVEKGDYLMTIEREGIFENKLVRLEGGQSMIEIPVKEKYLPAFYVALTSWTKREAPPADFFQPDLGKPRSLFGIIGLKVSTKPIELDVSILPGQPSYRPGKEAEVTVRVTRNGAPVADAEVTAIAVDRGVLDLIDYHVPDPVKYFYDAAKFPLGVDGDDSRRLLMKPLAYDTSALTGGDGDKLQERSDFRPLALFEPFARTDAKGEAKVRFKLPDSLTTYRMTAMAVNGSRVGIEEGEILVQNPVNVRAALPRRFRNRDTAAAGVVMKNLTAVPQKVQVTAESDILSVGGAKTRSVEIPPNGSYELPFILSAQEAGEGTITFTVRSEAVNERLVEKVVVDRPLVKEAFATVGTIAPSEAGTTEGLIIPGAIAQGYGGLSILASSTLRPYIEPSLGRLLDEWCWYLGGYYSRLQYSFASVYAGTGKQHIPGLMSDLKQRQLADGGIYTGGYFRMPYLPDPYISLLAAHFMVYAKARGYKTDGPDLGRLLSYLSGLQKKEKDFDPYFHAYNNMVLAAGAKADRAYLARTEAYEDSLGLGGYGLLAQAYLYAGDKASASRVFKRSKNFVMIGTQSVDLKDTYEVANYWSSEIAEMAILLKNAQEMGEDRGLVQRIAGSLNKSKRHWQGSNDDFWTLLGFIPLLDAEGPAKGSGSLAVDANGLALASLSMTPSRPQASKDLEFAAKPLSELKRDQLTPLNFAKTGDSPAYYTLIMRYALPNETAFARDEGIEVRQRYETLDGEKVGEKELKLGETYRVRVDLSTTKRRQRLELQVPIPDGLEIVDPTFATSGSFKDKGGNQSDTIRRETVYGDTIDVDAEGYGGWEDGDWYWYWYTPDSFALDNTMVYRWTDFYAGARTVSFIVRVTTPGIYPTPPATASLEFEPEVFGRSEGKLFVIKP